MGYLTVLALRSACLRAIDVFWDAAVESTFGLGVCPTDCAGLQLWCARLESYAFSSDASERPLDSGMARCLLCLFAAAGIDALAVVRDPRKCCAFAALCVSGVLRLSCLYEL